ncbi:hypothetical protein [Lewinella sp. W8]|uniref:hypothetical protein n=1 Tax=Lewinella sp. W8 TaxID=2528208 RepID=UPI0010682250|nr:hypothetical protein [Lewinella sp. W8]MTB49565.1 hypothetical protein [Lewinella sp. W8]
MDYLDYLLHCTYDELPVDVRESIGREEYAYRRTIARGLAPGANALPPALTAAFRERNHRPKAIPRSFNWRWAAAAGWLLFLCTAIAWGVTPTKSETVYRVMAADPPAPEIITKTDTLFEIRTAVKVIRDTLRIAAATVEPMTVYRIDTVYLPEGVPPPINGSKTLQGIERVLELMVGAK